MFAWVRFGPYASAWYQLLMRYPVLNILCKRNKGIIQRSVMNVMLIVSDVEEMSSKL